MRREIIDSGSHCLNFFTLDFMHIFTAEIIEIEKGKDLTFPHILAFHSSQYYLKKMSSQIKISQQHAVLKITSKDALAGVAQGIECPLVNQRITG